jgi:hypothetical protein
MDPSAKGIIHDTYKDCSCWGCIKGQFGYDPTSTVAVSADQVFENPMASTVKASGMWAASVLWPGLGNVFFFFGLAAPKDIWPMSRLLSFELDMLTWFPEPP